MVNNLVSHCSSTTGCEIGWSNTQLHRTSASRWTSAIQRRAAPAHEPHVAVSLTHAAPWWRRIQGQCRVPRGKGMLAGMQCFQPCGCLIFLLLHTRQRTLTWPLTDMSRDYSVCFKEMNLLVRRNYFLNNCMVGNRFDVKCLINHGQYDLAWIIEHKISHPAMLLNL